MSAISLDYVKLIRELADPKNASLSAEEKAKRFCDFAAVCSLLFVDDRVVFCLF